MSTAARAASTCAFVWFTFASKMSGSMRAMTWPFFTWELKSTRSCLTCPETCDPTCTVMTAFRVPDAEIAATTVPRVIGAVRNGDLLPEPCR